MLAKSTANTPTNTFVHPTSSHSPIRKKKKKIKRLALPSYFFFFLDRFGTPSSILLLWFRRENHSILYYKKKRYHCDLQKLSLSPSLEVCGPTMNLTKLILGFSKERAWFNAIGIYNGNESQGGKERISMTGRSRLACLSPLLPPFPQGPRAAACV